ncbi:transcription elongation regulator 1-like protein isoform X2 [Engystomops pustulosus]|uniref:transcription elongation regulator 1-like protein isoform X2 n=1 Tax=Engystomops pustulosus TaxID=76066 RepID=UPI003AFA735F
MIPFPRIKRQPFLWPVNAEPAPWICMVPDTPGVFRIGAVPPPLIVSCAPPSPLLQGASAWQVPCDPFLPLMSVPAAPEPAVHQFPLANGQWVGGHSPAFGFSPSSSLEIIPLFPHVYTSTIPPHPGKCWVEKKTPNCKIFLNNSFALDSSWIHPAEELILFQGLEKPSRRTNQVTMAISRPSTAPRPLHTVILTPQRVTGSGQNVMKPGGSNQSIAIVGAMTVPPTTLMGMESDSPQGLASMLAPPCHMLTISPIKIPLLASQLPDKSKEVKRATCSTAFILHSERKTNAAKTSEKANVLKMPSEDDCVAKINKPVASTPVPGSPWCVVWTGDDKVFFFNPTIQLSVWDKPIDLKDRVDINRIIEDPPHKRKLESPATGKKDGLFPEDVNEEHSSKVKRNRTEDSQTPEQGEEEEEKSSSLKSLPPLEERMSCFRNMLLERGVSAFSTWEKELHKIVFDPRYLLLNSEERKQVFEQFVKTRIKEEYKEKRSKLMLAKEEFKKLLEESKLSPRTTFKEFAEKYGRDQRFRVVQKKKDQEHFFNQFINSLKKRDKENRMRLRKMR